MLERQGEIIAHACEEFRSSKVDAHLFVSQRTEVSLGYILDRLIFRLCLVTVGGDGGGVTWIAASLQRGWPGRAGSGPP
jgi:hypothetical protein